eukprot:6492580-Amphidinium_carterae.1
MAGFRPNAFKTQKERLIAIYAKRVADKRAKLLSYPDWRPRSQGREPHMDRERLRKLGAFLQAVIGVGRVHQRGHQAALVEAFRAEGQDSWLEGTPVGKWAEVMAGRLALAIRHSWNLLHRLKCADDVHADPLISELFPAYMIKD